MRRFTNKRAAAHFEMIFAFVFFTGFVFFLFMVLQPQDTSTLSGSVIAALYDNFEEEVFTNLSSMFLKANYTNDNVEDGDADEDCFIIELPGRLFTYAIKSDESYVTDLAGTDVNSNLVAPAGDGELSINDDNVFFRVSVSPEFDDEGTTGCEVLEDYELGSILERRVVSKTFLNNMASDYTSDYEELRTRLRVPPIFDFAIVADNMSISMMPSRGIPESVEVMSREYVVEVLYPDGRLINERFNLMLW